MNKKLYGMRRRPVRATRVAALTAVSVALATCFVPAAQSFEVDTGNSNLSVRFDNTVQYNAGWRMEGINKAFANSPTYDETELTSDRGDMVLNRIDLLTELDVVFNRRHGFRVSAASWYDEAYEGKSPRVNPAFAGSGAYSSGSYEGDARRFHRGLSGEILDAFVFTNFELGQTSFNVKAGKHTTFWGESLFNAFHGISYAQGPLDGLKGASNPSVTAKEVFMPVNQLSFQVQPTEEVAFGGTYYLEWKPNRLPEGGTYFGASDHLWNGPDRLFLANHPLAGPLFAKRGADVKPENGAGNNFGLFLRWSPQWLDGTWGFYYRKFDETQPWPSVLGLAPPSPLPTNYHQVYAKDTEMYAMSLARSLGPVSFGSELVYRKNTALNSASSFAAVRDFAGVGEGPRGDTLHVLANGVYLLPQTSVWDGGSLNAEFVYSRLLDVTTNEALYKGMGYSTCAGLGKADGCSTENYSAVRVDLKPEWIEVAPGVDLKGLLSLSYGIDGNAATLGGGTEGEFKYSLGVEAYLYKKYTVGLRYNDSRNRYTTTNGVVRNVAGNAVSNNHGWLNLYAQMSF